MSGGPARAASVVERLRRSEQTLSHQRQEQMMSSQMPFRDKSPTNVAAKRNNQNSTCAHDISAVASSRGVYLCR